MLRIHLSVRALYLRRERRSFTAQPDKITRLSLALFYIF